MISAYAPVAQLDRALDFESRGRGFESYPVRHYKDPRSSNHGPSDCFTVNYKVIC